MDSFHFCLPALLGGPALSTGFCQTLRWNSLPHLRRSFAFHSRLRLFLESVCARHPAATHFSNSSPKNIPGSRQFSLHLVTDTRGLAGEVSNWPKILELTQVPVTLEAGPQRVEPPCQVMALPATAATVVATAFILDCPQGSLVLCTLGHNTQYPSLATVLPSEISLPWISYGLKILSGEFQKTAG